MVPPAESAGRVDVMPRIALQPGGQAADAIGMRNPRALTGLGPLLALLLLPGCAAARRTDAVRAGDAEVGTASYIAPALAGRATASGARFDPDARVAAHRTLPFGTRLRVTNLANDRSVIVTVVDRGPFKRERLIDVSPAAARALGFLRAGTARVRIERVGGPLEAEAEPR